MIQSVFKIVALALFLTFVFSSCRSDIEGKWELEDDHYPQIKIETNDKVLSKLMESRYREMKRLNAKDIKFKIRSNNRVHGKEDGMPFRGRYEVNGDTLIMITMSIDTDTGDARYMRDDTIVYNIDMVRKNTLKLSRDVKESNVYIWENPITWESMGINPPTDLEIFSEKLVYLFERD